MGIFNYFKKKKIEIDIEAFALAYDDYTIDKLELEVSLLSKKINLYQMEKAVDIYLENDVSMQADELKFKRMHIIKVLCLNYGEGICNYLDKIAFGEYDWTQYGAIELLCLLANKKDIRVDKTLKLISENINEFRYETEMNTLTFLRHFKKHSEITLIFDNAIEKYSESITDLLHILEFYYQYDKNEAIKHKKYLRKIAINNVEADFNIAEIAYILKKDENGNYIPYDENGNVINEKEIIEFIKIKAALFYIKMDNSDIEIINFIKKIQKESEFKNNIEFINQNFVSIASR